MHDVEPDGQETPHRLRGFQIAVLLVGGSLLLVAVPVVRGDVEGGKELAGIFSGWIAAIVGFYFFQGQAQQAATAAEVAERARAAAAFKSIQASFGALRRENAELREDLRKALNRVQDYKEVEEP